MFPALLSWSKGGDNITWFRSSEKVRRGFCSTCGCSLFWDPIEKNWIGIAMGAFDLPTNTKQRIHIHVAEKGDYYEIAADGLPHNQHIPKSTAWALLRAVAGFYLAHRPDPDRRRNVG